MKNAFTLIEVLAILVVLAILTLLVVPSVRDSIKSGKETVYDSQVRTIKSAADSYIMNTVGEVNGKVIYVEDIINKGYIESNQVIDPHTNREMTGCVLVTLSSNQYRYQYIDDLTQCQTYTKYNE